MGKRAGHYVSTYDRDLTPRQREVLALLAHGQTNAQIAAQLGIGYESVKTHVSDILARLEVDSREQAAAMWNADHGRWSSARRTATSFFVMGWAAPAAVVVCVVIAVVAGLAFVAAKSGDRGQDAPASSARGSLDEELAIIRALDPADGRVMWEVQPDAKWIATAGIIDDVAVVGMTDAVVAYDLTDGSERWRFPMAVNGFRYEPPRTFGGAVIASDQGASGPPFDPSWIAIDAATGLERWRYRPGRGFGFAVAGNDKVVVVEGGNPNTGDFHVAALDTRTGAVRWTIDFQEAPRTQLSVATSGDVVGITGWSEELRAFDLETGVQLWSTSFETISGLSSAGGSFFVKTYSFGANGETRYEFDAVDPATGAILWTTEADGDLPVLETSPYPIEAEGVLLLQPSAREIAAVDPSTGSVQWTHPADGFSSRSSTFQVAGSEDVFYTSDSFRVQQRDLSDGSILWEVALWTSGQRLVLSEPEDVLIVTTHGKAPPYRD